MSLKKQFIKTKPVVKVTFSIDAKDADSAAVVGTGAINNAASSPDNTQNLPTPTPCPAIVFTCT